MILAGATLALSIALSLWSFVLAGRPGAPRWLRWLPLLLGLTWAVGTTGMWLTVGESVAQARSFATFEVASLLFGAALLLQAHVRSVSSGRRRP